ncbi:kinase-like domain-containing protein [Suillus spraguei]|nr:kinase-like domain-containing protein [Suillus spraguei]
MLLLQSLSCIWKNLRTSLGTKFQRKDHLYVPTAEFSILVRITLCCQETLIRCPNLTSKIGGSRLIGRTSSANVYGAVYYTSVSSKRVCAGHSTLSSMSLQKTGCCKSLRIEKIGNIVSEGQELLNRANTWITLRHDNILTPIGFADGFGPLPSIVYDWMPGGTLTSYLKEDSDSLSVLQRFYLIRQVAAGLCYLHDKNVIHGNIHGNNVLIDAMAVAYLADYNVTAAHRGEHIPPSNVFDSQNVVAPTTESDIYSLGSVIYQILTGREPYYEVRDKSKVSIEILDGNKPSRLHHTHIADRHWLFMQKCWTVPESRPSAAEVLHFSQTEVEHLTA